MPSRPFTSGRLTTMRRSKRPGRSSAGSSTSGRLVAATRMTPSFDSNPSISTSSWLSVCSRSSWPPPRPAPRCRPTASISSMKTMQGAFFLPCSKRSRTREAPTPTNISTKSEPLIEKNGTLASPATARASSVLPVPGEPISRTPLGMRPPSFWNFCGSFRNSMISWSSSLASSTPETSLKVTFFCELDDSFARLLPNERALFPPLCICRMMKIQKPIISRIGAQEYSTLAHGLVVSGLASILTPFSSSRLASRSYWVGAYVRNSAALPATPFRLPVIWLPVITTDWTCPSLTSSRKSVNEMGAGPRWNPAEKFQIMIPTPMRTIQNSKLLRVEFNLRLLTALLSRVSRPSRGLVTRKSSATDWPTTQTIRSSLSTTSGRASRSARAIFRSTRKSCNFRPARPCPSA